MPFIERGDLRWFRFNRPDKRRPVLVLGSEELLPHWSRVPVIPLSTRTRGLRWEIRLGPEDGLRSACVVKPELITSVERTALGSLIAAFPVRLWAPLHAALSHVLGFV